jgi:type IV pilus assembly protein PilN
MSVSARINLLPWREEERKRQNIEFGIMAGAGAVLTLLIVFAIYMYFDDRINHQEQRNQFLGNEIGVLDAKLETIRGLEEKKQSLLDRMNVIQELQGRRPETVHLFEELVTTIPDGIWLKSIEQKGHKLTLKGSTESNARVSAYMRNLDESEWMTNPQLVTIKKGSEGKGAEFQLSLEQTSPSQAADEGER